ncbi:MAG TPA: NAD(P)H-binding protein [Candidatus Solibacter sp.]|nr:NAD(P)H-binding protein [Candidatus Solibacter sp.]
MATVFITGAGGFMGSRLAAELLRRGHTVRGLVRRGPAPAGCETVMGNALDSGTWADRIPGCDTFVHLVGVAHPSPAKAAQFRSIDFAGARVAIAAARATGIAHFVYVSVAHPAPVMREYIAARTEAEAALRASGLNATILRPWYVLGPGRWWPLMLLPAYWLMEAIPTTRADARRLGLVRWQQMILAMANAVDRPPQGVRVLEVPDIRRASA